MKHLLIIAGLLGGILISNAQLPIQEIRTASNTELVAFFHSTNVSGPVYATVYSTNEVNLSQPLQWFLNGQRLETLSEFVTESDGVDYHIYMQVPPLTNGMAYTLTTPYGTTNFVFEDTNILCESIKVNQDGYSALSHVRYANFAVWLGTAGSQPLDDRPGYTVIDQTTGQQVAEGTLQLITTAGPDTSSGDYVYRIDLSAVPEGGPYRIIVNGVGSSYPFGVGGDFSRRLGYVAFRALYYQRCGCPIVKPYAWANIRPYGCHTNIYDNESPDNPSTSSINTNTSGARLFVHGGYHDAGDTQKNPYALETPIILMTTYEVFPQDFTDQQFNIPNNFDASFNILPGSNGIPDILDEANWGLMLYTNLQSTPKEPSGAVAFGTASRSEPIWGINFDQDTLIYVTETNNGWCSGLAAGAFMNFARLIRPYNAPLSADFAVRGAAAYAASGSKITTQGKLYYAIQEYLLNGDTTSSNIIESMYTTTSLFTNTFDDEASGFAVNNGQIWMPSYFMSYIIATNRPTDPVVVAYFKSILQKAADKETGYINGDAYPVGWPTNANPYTQNNYAHRPYTSQGEFAYPCLMEWALTGTQKYIDTVSQLMDYDHGLNPIGKCYMSGMGFDRVHNPHMIETVYGEEHGFGGPEPGITVYGPGNNNNGTIPLQIPAALTLPRERMWVDDLGNFQWSEFTDYQSEAWPAAIYPILGQGGNWSPAQGEPFLNPVAAIDSITNGWVLRFGGIPGQTYVLQTASAMTGPWSAATSPVRADITGTVQFTDVVTTQTNRFYRTQAPAPIY
ncbi:MAG TPA: glycoside hydrolase family 9 protein [Verrucomicrobiae bacterium]|jgi:endoglucanase|nr:glycoside hydrolase family 9 protein [Verrucomicrobiae bacterium]